MVSHLTPADLRKLIGILGLLGSDYDGERAAAGLLASRLLRERGLTWDRLLSSSGVDTSRTTPSSARDGGGWLTMLAFCRRHQTMLSGWELHFVTDLQYRRTPPTSRQVAKIGQIADALRARGLT